MIPTRDAVGDAESKTLVARPFIHQTMQDARADFEAARDSRLKRVRTGLGGTADFHLLPGAAWRLREEAREFVRNVIGVRRLFWRWAVSVVGTGFSLHPDTGTPELDAAIRSEYREWAADRSRCDFAGRRGFNQMLFDAANASRVDGDHFMVMTDKFSIQQLEGDRCTSPAGQHMSESPLPEESGKARYVQGVKISGEGVPLAYSFSKAATGWLVLAESHVAVQPAEKVIHIYDPVRTSNTRGVTALHSCLKVLGMKSDLEFTELTRAQMSACITIAIENTENSAKGPFGPKNTETIDGNGNTAVMEGLAPGLIINMRKGQKMAGFSPDIPNLNVMAFARDLARQICVDLDLCLEAGMIDFEGTNFSGHRAAIEEMRRSHRVSQTFMIDNVLSRMYWWLVPHLVERIRARGKVAIPGEANIRAHRWTAAGWGYIEPSKDVQADILAVDAGYSSPRDVCAKNGEIYEITIREKTEDIATAIDLAMTASEELEKKHPGQECDWREIYRQSQPMGVTQQLTPQPDVDETQAGSVGKPGGSQDNTAGKRAPKKKE